MTKPPKLVRTDLEGNLKKQIIKFLKAKGCKVRVNEQNATTAAAFPDLTFYYEGFYGMIEVKKSAKARWRPGQKQAIEFWDDWSWARGVWPENWPEIKRELEIMLR